MIVGQRLWQHRFMHDLATFFWVRFYFAPHYVKGDQWEPTHEAAKGFHNHYLRKLEMIGFTIVAYDDQPLRCGLRTGPM